VNRVLSWVSHHALLVVFFVLVIVLAIASPTFRTPANLINIVEQRFRAGGFPISLVADQNALVRELSAPGTYIYSGVQMWNLPPEELFEAAVASYASDADDVIYYCYGWAASELIGASNGAREAAAERKSC